MSIFNKTTGIDFQEFGEIFNETTFKNQYVEGRFYLAIDKKETNKFYKSEEEIYLSLELLFKIW